MVRILVVDDHLVVGEGTKSILETSPYFLVDYICLNNNKQEILNTDFTLYDLLLVDLNLGQMNGLDLSKDILRLYPSSKIVLYTGYDIEDYYEEAVKVGIRGVLSKSETKEKLISQINNILDNRIDLPFSLLQRIIKKTQNMISKGQQQITLNSREVEILKHVESGLTNQEIADYLYLSKRSIEYSLTSIFNKLEVKTRTEAMLIAKSYGFIN